MVAVQKNPKDIAQLIESNLEIPTIPVVASKALRAMQDPNANAPKLATILQDDPGLTASILKTANSALFALPREVKNLAQAAMVLGFGGLKNIVLGAVCRGIYKRYGDRERSLWVHSVGTAHAAQEISKATASPADEAFVAGLLHDIGRVVMNNGSRDRLIEAEQLAAAESLDQTDAEQKIFGYTHTDVGALLVDRWELSASLRNAVFFHHDLELIESLVDEEYRYLVYVTNLADQICYRATEGADEDALALHETDAAMALGMDEATIATLVERVAERVSQSEG